MLDLKILAVGCSMTRGHGLLNEQNDTNLWVNKIFKDIGTVTNISESGRNNQWIFLEAMSEITKNFYDIVLVGWSTIPRFNFHAGLELYSVQTTLQNNVDVNVNPDITFKGSWLTGIGDNLRKIHNDHWDILDTVKYVNALIRVQEKLPTRPGKIFFVNTMSPWESRYFDYKKITVPSELTWYEQEILQASTRDDSETLALYNMIHSQYAYYGGIQELHWLNLYQSLKSMQIDQVSDVDFHPGYVSQNKYSEYLAPILKEKLELN